MKGKYIKIACFVALTIAQTLWYLDFRSVKLECGKVPDVVTQIERVYIDETSVIKDSLLGMLRDSVLVLPLDSFGHGSGVKVGPNVILTARHVAEHDDGFAIVDRDGNVYVSERVVLSKNADCALIYVKTDEYSKCFTDYSVMSCKDAKLLDTVVCVGAPSSVEYTRTVITGNVTNACVCVPFFGRYPVTLVDLPAASGFSGSGVYNVHGKLTGVLVGAIDRFGNTVVIVPISSCKELLED